MAGLVAPPLRIVVLAHAASEDSRKLTDELYQRFTVAGGAPGLRIPVELGVARADRLPPERPALRPETHTLHVVLVDRRMARRAEPADRPVADAWGGLVHDLVTQLAADTAHGVLPVAVDDGAFQLDPRLAERSFVRLDVIPSPADRHDVLARQVAIAALRLLKGGGAVVAPSARAPISLFVSHAKVDTPHTAGVVSAGPVHELLAYLAQHQVTAWFDSSAIPPGASFADEIEHGVIDADVVVCVLTDHWSDREWCRREALFAKRTGRPLVIVDATEHHAARLFPYLGNAPLLRWRPGDAPRVVLSALTEALRQCHARGVLDRRKRPGDVVFSAPPEALTLRQLPPGTARVLYPDPPLPHEELDALTAVHPVDPDRPPPRLELTTPLSQLARQARAASLDLVGLSLSAAPDLAAHGGSAAHLATVAEDLVIMLLVAGIRLAYGGTIGYPGGPAFDTNYTSRLFALVRSYSPLAQRYGASRLHPIENFVAWPRHLAFGDAELAEYGREAQLVRVPRPALAVSDAELGADSTGWFPAGTPIQRWAYARGLHAQRLQLNAQLAARIAVGGRLTGYSGLLPGVLEEIVLACRAPVRPVYLLGAFGGATRLAIDLLEQRPRVEATTAWVTANVARHAELVAEHARRGDPVVSPEQAADTLRALGARGPARALDNGLDDDANRELFHATDSHRIVELILTGLAHKFPAPSGAPS